MNENIVSKFFCKVCGGHDLVVTHVWSTTIGRERNLWLEWGPLKEDHQWLYEFMVQIDENTYNVVRAGGLNRFKQRQFSSEHGESEINATATIQERDEYFVNCAICDREIEFGWSQPEHQGLIFPVEYSDFNAFETWPDPKYLDSMQPMAWSEKLTTVIMTVVMQLKRIPMQRWDKRSS